MHLLTRRAEHGTTLYILDEPTAGLHPADADRLLQQLQRLVDADNTVVIVEHDMRIVAQTDYVIDMGPGAGNLGGTGVAHGTPQQVTKVHDSATAPFLKKPLQQELSLLMNIGCGADKPRVFQRVD